MRDITQFIVTVFFPRLTSAIVFQRYRQDILMKFRLCYLVIIDYDALFKSIVLATYEWFNVECHVVVKRIYKSVSVDKYYSFLNKVVTITSNDRGGIGVFIESCVTTAYVWNIASIGDIEIISIILIIERDFPSPLDINFTSLFILTRNQVESVVQYLRLIYICFTTSIL